MRTRSLYWVDLDGVVADFYTGLRVIAAEWLDVPIEMLQPMLWAHGMEGGPPPAVMKHCIGSRYPAAVVQAAQTNDWRAATLRRLSSNDVRIRIITHRLFTKYFHSRRSARPSSGSTITIFSTGTSVS